MYATSPIDSRPRRGAGGGGTAPTAVAGPTGPVENTWALEHRPEAPAAARRIARRVLDVWQVGADGQDAALLVVSELVTNAVEHARAPISLHLHRAGDRVWIGVSDGGPAQQEGAWVRSCARDEHGRGLAVVRALTGAHGIRPHPGGRTTHWARLGPGAV